MSKLNAKELLAKADQTGQVYRIKTGWKKAMTVNGARAGWAGTTAPSIMPVVSGGNTNAPTIMIAEKAAELIRRPRLLAAPLDQDPVSVVQSRL